MTHNTSNASKLYKIIDEFGRLPLEGTPMATGPLVATPETLLAMVIDSLLKSRPISHNLSQRAVSKLIEAGYHDIEELKRSSWEEKALSLEEGGYNRYREQGATNLDELALLVDEKYDGNLNNLLVEGGYNKTKVRALIKEVKGLGDLGVDIFFNNVQSVWPSMAPSIDARSLKTADEVGIGTDLDAIYAELKRDPIQMSKLAIGLSNVRLEKKTNVIKDRD